MHGEFPKSNWTPAPFLALFGAVVLAAGLFLVIPLTQSMSVELPVQLDVREVNLAAPPPPKPPPLPEEEFKPVEKPTPQAPQLESQVSKMELQQLEMNLSPGLGASLSMGVQRMNFETEVNVAAVIKSIFEFDELEERPRLINRPRLIFPRELERRGVREVKVIAQIVIDETGRTQVEKIISSSYDHPSVERAARQTISQARYTVPRRDGQPVKATRRFQLKMESAR
jgi:TonB family protein